MVCPNDIGGCRALLVWNHEHHTSSLFDVRCLQRVSSNSRKCWILKAKLFNTLSVRRPGRLIPLEMLVLVVCLTTGLLQPSVVFFIDVGVVLLHTVSQCRSYYKC